MLRGQSNYGHTASVRTNLVRTNPIPVSSFTGAKNKSPSNNFSGPPTASIRGHTLRGRMR